MSSGGTNPPNDKGGTDPPNDKRKDVASTTTRPTHKRKWRTYVAPQHVLDRLNPMPTTKDTQTGKDVPSTTTRPTHEEIRVDKSIPMLTSTQTQTPSPRTYAPPPPTHTSSAVYPQHAYAPPRHASSAYTLPPIYPPPTYQHHAYASSANTPPLYPPPTNPLLGGPSHKQPPSGKGKGVGSTTTSHFLKVTSVVSSAPDQCILVPATAHTQIPSSHTYAPPPPAHTSSVVYPQHAYAPPKLTPSGYTLPPIYPPPTYSHHAYAPSVNPPPTNPLSGGPLHKRPPSGKGKGVGSTTTSHSRKVTPVVSSSPDQFIPVPTTAHTQIPSPHTYVPPLPTSSQSPSTQFPLHVYPLNAYAPSTYALPTYPLSSEPSKKRPASDKEEDIASTTNGRSRKVTRVVSAHTQTPSPCTYTQPPPTRSQSPSTQFPLLVYPPHTYAPPAYTPSTSTPPTYPLSSGPSHKVPQFSSIPNPGFQGTQGTPLKSSHPKPSQPPPYQAGQDSIHDDVEPDAEGINMFDDGRHVIQPSTKG